MVRNFFYILVITSMFGGAFVFAASHDVIVRTQIGEDTTPPTTPILTSVTAISDDQIDLVWDPSTDDFILSGYTIERDGTHLATTTQTTYSDTGLAASTTYSYVIRAFDWMNNVSSSSNALATTTLAAPVVPPPATTSTSSRVATASGKLSLRGELSVAVTPTSTRLAWQTNRPSRYILRWGRTTSYELGSIATERYSEGHVASLTDLSPNTTYYYELAAFNPAAPVAQILKSGSFKTASIITPTTPPNVTRLVAVVERNDVLLSWKNPTLIEGGYTVRVVRSHVGYPLDLQDGMVVAQGVMESWRDVSALSAYGIQFYTVFVIDGQGNVSSGALATARVATGQSATSSVLQPVEVPPDVVLPLLSPDQIVVSQGGVLHTFESEVLLLDPTQPILLTIPASALPARLKSIIVTLTDPTDSRRAYRFLLRLNQAGDAYETTLAPLSVQGTSLLLLEVYDLEAYMVGRYGRQVNFVAPAIVTEVLFPDVFYRYWPWMIAIILLLGGGVLVHRRWYVRT